MTDFRASKVVANLPSKLEPNTSYWVRAGEGFDLYLSDITGSVAHKINSKDPKKIPKDFFISCTINNKYLTYKTDTYRKFDLSSFMGIEILNTNEVIRVNDDLYITFNFFHDARKTQDIAILRNCYLEDNELKFESFLVKSTTLDLVHALVYNKYDDHLYISDRPAGNRISKILKLNRYTLDIVETSNFPSTPTFMFGTTDIKIFNNKLYVGFGNTNNFMLLEVNTNLKDYRIIYQSNNDITLTHSFNQPFEIYNNKVYITAYDNTSSTDQYKHIKIIEVNLITKAIRISNKLPITKTTANAPVLTHWLSIWADKLLVTLYSYGNPTYYSGLARVNVKTLNLEEDIQIDCPVTDDNSILEGYLYLNGESFPDSFYASYPNYPRQNAKLIKINPLKFTDISFELNPYNDGYGSYGSINYSATNNIQLEDLTVIGNLKPVATTGNYNDLVNKPILSQVSSTGDYNHLINRPTLSTISSTGNYNDLINKPVLATVATSGNYNDLINKPVETDSVFKASPAYSITSANISNWNTAAGAISYNASNYSMYLNNKPVPTLAYSSNNGNAYSNTFIGIGASGSFNVGWRNTIIGAYAYNSATGGGLNTAIGNSAMMTSTGDCNVAIGTWALSKNIGSNNVVIGNLAGSTGVGTGVAQTNYDNKLIIHSTKWNYISDLTTEYNRPLVLGDFVARWFKIHGKLILEPSTTPVADSTYSKILISNNNGDIGSIQTNIANGIPTLDSFGKIQQSQLSKNTNIIEITPSNNRCNITGLTYDTTIAVIHNSITSDLSINLENGKDAQRLTIVLDNLPNNLTIGANLSSIDSNTLKIIDLIYSSTLNKWINLSKNDFSPSYKDYSQFYNTLKG